MAGSHFIYMHVQLDAAIPFYVGQGKVRSRTSANAAERTVYERAFHRRSRTALWKNVAAKHGLDVLILDCGLTQNEADELEIRYIARLGRRDLGTGPLVNLSEGGGGPAGWVATPEWKDKVSKALRGRKRPQFTQEWRDNISRSGMGRASPRKGVVLSQETRQKISEASKGRIPWNKGLRKNTDPQ